MTPGKIAMLKTLATSPSSTPVLMAIDEGYEVDVQTLNSTPRAVADMAVAALQAAVSMGLSDEDRAVYTAVVLSVLVPGD